MDNNDALAAVPLSGRIPMLSISPPNRSTFATHLLLLSFPVLPQSHDCLVGIRGCKIRWFAKSVWYLFLLVSYFLAAMV